MYVVASVELAHGIKELDMMTAALASQAQPEQTAIGWNLSGVNLQAFMALVREHQDSHWPLYYQDDLYVHDRDNLAGLPQGSPFGWLVRETGTWFIRPRWLFENLNPGYDWDKADGAIARYCERHQRHRAYLWTGTQLLGVRDVRTLNSILRQQTDWSI